MKKLLLITFVLVNYFAYSQFTNSFQSAYNSYPNLPKGILEAVSWSNTHMRDISSTEYESCSGIPRALGVMGLFYDGKNYFRENAILVENLSGISISQQLTNPDLQIKAYAHALSVAYSNYYNQFNSESKALYFSLNSLSEIPDSGEVNQYALDAQIYQILRYMNDHEFAQQHNFQVKNYDLKAIFGFENLKVLSASKVLVSENAVSNELGNNYSLSLMKSAEYGPAIWNPAPSCNYSSRNGTAVSAITIHTIQGSYAGAISWAKNCESNVSYHYVIRSSDGQVTQLVVEATKAWHVGSENPYTIGYEHEGWVNDASWYTQAMYQSSANLSRDITNSGYGISPLRTYYGASTSGTNLLGACTKIKGHQHFPNQSHTDPGINWNWEKYYKLINNSPAITTITAASGVLYDTGGASGNYGNDERKLWLIQPTNVASVTINFSQFVLENNWDFLFIYDGATTNAPLIGKYTGTNSPGSISSTGGSILIEFRSDCATTAAGWKINYTSVSNTPASPPVTSILQGNNWYTSDFTVNINDVSSQSTIAERFYMVKDRLNSTSDWLTQGSKGFASDNFTSLSSDWVQPAGNTFTVSNNRLVNNDIASSNTNIYMNVNQTNTHDYLYSWTQRFKGTGTDKRAGLHFMCSDPTFANRGNSYFVYLRETDDKVQIFSVANDVHTMQTNDVFTIDNATDYKVKVTFSPTSGWIRVYINNVLASSWKDTAPLQSGNSVSFRSANTEIEYDDFNIYQSRSNILQVTTGAGGLMRYESVNGIPTGRVIALSRDANNWSSATSVDFLIDKTSPILNFINDGLTSDLSQFSGQTISGNWSFTEPHSDIANYEYAIGTSPNDDDVITWSSVGGDSFFTTPFTTGVIDQLYYVSIKATNGAGLIAQACSNGQKYVQEDLTINDALLDDVIIYPNPFSDELKIDNLPEKSIITVYDMNGKIIYSSDSNKANEIIYLNNVSSGVYQLKIAFEQNTILHRIVKL